tara:strand:- start:145 stop:1122 length:978 start_codon:yes stop_codon:yes gene_type:complete
MKSILVTGGAGYIGSHIVEQLIKIKKKVLIVDNLTTGYKKLINKKANFYLCDIKNFKKLNKIFKENQISSVIHLAASLSVGESEKKPKKYYSNNVSGTKNVIRCCKQNKIKNLIFSSTCAVYKDGMRIVKENSKVNPKSIYGKTKLSAEKFIKKNLNKGEINYAILRYFNVAGASNSGKIGQITRGDQLFKNLSIASIKNKPKINIYGDNYQTKDGTCIRDYIHVSDIANIHLLVLNKIDREKKSIVLNCGYGNGISVLEAIKEFEKQIKKKFVIEIKNRRKGDMKEIIADNSKIKRYINWSPKKNSLNNIVRSCIKWEKKFKLY